MITKSTAPCICSFSFSQASLAHQQHAKSASALDRKPLCPAARQRKCRSPPSEETKNETAETPSEDLKLRQLRLVMASLQLSMNTRTFEEIGNSRSSYLTK